MPDIRRISYRYSLSILRQPRQQPGRGETVRQPAAICQILCYRLMCNHLEAYGDITIDKITTAYLQDFIKYLQSQGMKPGSVRLYFQKLACVLHDAYKNGLFDDRILQRVKRPKREQEKKSFLSETELKKLAHHRLSEEYNNIQSMFLFSCMTGLRYSDVQGLRWKDVKRSGKHLQLEFHQQKTDTYERLPFA